VKAPVCQERSGRPEVDVCTSRFEPLSYLLGLWVVEGLLSGYRGVKGNSGALENLGSGSADTSATLHRHDQGCVEVP
jgi:hypothetical protein